MISNSRIIGAVEIGTHKVTVLIGEITGGRSLNIIGMGHCASNGVIKGVIVDYKAASDSTHAALEAAEKRAGVRVDGVFLAQSGGHLDGFYHEAAVNVTSADNTVSQRDIDTVCHLARAKQLPADRTVIHYLRRPFKLDGQAVPSPEDLAGRRLEAGYWISHGDERKVSDNIHIVNGFNVKVLEIILASLASGTMVTTPEERQHGALVIDIGRGTTDYVLYRDGHPWVTGVVPIGGDHLTNDLSLGLRLTPAHAETMKLRHGHASMITRDKNEKVWLNGDFAIGDRHFSRQAIEQITSARITELLEVVRKKLGAEFQPERLGAGVVLTGGTSRLSGIEDLGTRVFGVTTRRGENPSNLAEELRDPQFSTVLGLLFYGLNQATDRIPGAGHHKANVFKRVAKFFATV